MLKWAVNNPRQTYLQHEHLEPSVTVASSQQQQRKRLRRKSSDLSALKSAQCWLDQKNPCTSTPLHTRHRSFSESPSRKIDSLRDLTNIRVSEGTTSSEKLQNPNPASSQSRKNIFQNYASTLPTFDVEYSPCAFIPGPMLALRGVGIHDSYFEKPRYLATHPVGGTISEELFLETKTLQKPGDTVLKLRTCMEESTLDSAKMGDVTLERMIDAILDNNRKDHKLQQSQKSLQQQSVMSPTYTPAEDPASDLHEVWDSEKLSYRQKERKFKAKLTKKKMLDERYLYSPRLQQTIGPHQLSRQGGLRRKRKISQITASVMSSAQRLLGKGGQAVCPHSRNQRELFEIEIVHDQTHRRKMLHNLSPDSGHNSSTDYEDSESESAVYCATDDNKTFDVTKRRLSFSLQNLNNT